LKQFRFILICILLETRIKSLLSVPVRSQGLCPGVYGAQLSLFTVVNEPRFSTRTWKCKLKPTQTWILFVAFSVAARGRGKWGHALRVADLAGASAHFLQSFKIAL